jgi:putative membrane protein
MMYDDRGWGWGWWMMGGGLLLLLLVLVAAVVAVVVAARPPRDVPPTSVTPAAPGQGRSPSDEALRELDLRFARGEVDEDAYRRTRDLLTHPPAR